MHIKSIREICARGGSYHILREENGYLYGFAEGIYLLGQAGKNNRIGVELTELLGAYAVRIVKAVNDAVGVLVFIGISELKHMEAREQVARTNALKRVFPRAELKVLGDLERFNEVILVALGLKKLYLLVYPPGRGATVALEFFLKRVEVAPRGIVAHLVCYKRTGEGYAAADLAAVGLVYHHITLAHGAEAEQIVGVGEHIAVFAIGEIVAHMLDVKINALAVKLAVCTGVYEKPCRVVALDEIVDLSDPRLMSGLTDLVTDAVDHKRGVVIEAVNDVDKLTVGNKIVFAVEHFGQVVIIEVFSAHLNVHEHTAVVCGTEALLGWYDGMKAYGVVAVLPCGGTLHLALQGRGTTKWWKGYCLRMIAA